MGIPTCGWWDWYPQITQSLGQIPSLQKENCVRLVDERERINDGNFWKFDKGEGILVKSYKNEENNKKQKQQQFFQSEEGEEISE
jgi:hypothetical protein